MPEQRKYLVNDKSQRTVTENHQGMVAWYIKNGYREVSHQEYKDFRQAHPEGTTWVISVNGPNRKRIEALAKSAGVRPQDFAGSIVAHWLKEHFGEA